MTYNENLLRKADAALADGGRIPLDLHAKLISAGMDTQEIERQHALKEQD